ncbi:MAG TPA: DUF4159 domain-containing protein [Tepidisphaeraceae bacterium]|nr:DUF4159 domain-containing protein [Tepidisphaeraceae bacterium]
MAAIKMHGHNKAAVSAVATEGPPPSDSPAHAMTNRAIVNPPKSETRPPSVAPALGVAGFVKAQPPEQVGTVASPAPATQPAPHPTPAIAAVLPDPLPPAVPTTQPSPAPAVSGAPSPSPTAAPQTQPAVASDSGNPFPPRLPATRPSDADQQNALPAAAVSINDDRVEKSIRRGVDNLLAQFVNGRLLPQQGANESRQAGLDALCVYSLLQAGRAIKDDRLDPKQPQMKLMLDRLKDYPLEPSAARPFEPVVYARSLRAAALALYDRPEDRKALQDDVVWLVNEEVDGAYSYGGHWMQQPDADPGAPPIDIRMQPGSGGGGSVTHHYTPAGKDPNNRVTPPQTYIQAPPLVIPNVAPPANPHQPGVPVFNQPAPTGGRGTPTYGPGPGYGPSNVPPPAPAPPPQFVAPPPTAPPDGAYGLGDGAIDAPVAVLAAAAVSESPGGWLRLEPVQGANANPVKNRFLTSAEFPWDNSNSQYGLLGVWSGAEVGIEVPERYWRDVEGHWMRSELKTGEWGYRATDGQGSLAMNCAGVASLFVTHDWIQAPQLHGAVGREIYGKALAVGLEWLETGNNCLQVTSPKTHYMGYDLFGVERIGLASGFKYFGGHDWYRELGQKALTAQWPTGAWGRQAQGQDSVIDTAYVLLFLSSGRHPIFMNKLRFEGGTPAAPNSWSNRPRDIANLTRFATRELEHPLNWQVVSLDRPWQDWMDCPVLYLASHRPPELKEADYEKLRRFVEAGGLLFTHSDGNSGTFNKWVTQTLAPKVCPGCGFKTLADDDPIFSTQYAIRPPHMKLMGAGNGSRLLLVHSPGDLAASWQGRSEKLRLDQFRLGVNLFVYAAGKTDLRNRLLSPVLPDPPAPTKPATKIARLRYAGAWDPEPAAWPRFATAWQTHNGSALEVNTINLADLRPGDAPLAHLTGTAAQNFTDQEATALRVYVEAGGVVLIDPCGGSKEFSDSVTGKLLSAAFPNAAPQDLPPGNGLLRGIPTMAADPTSPRLRPFAADRFKAALPHVRMLSAGKGCVILSPLDITTGLLGTNTWPVLGYGPASSVRLAENAVLWAQSRLLDKQ